MWKLRTFLVTLGAAMALVGPATGWALDFKRLVMPGKVIQGHAKIEAECSKCHKPFSKGDQRTLCMDCHKEVAKDIKAGRGFHGRSRDVKGVECKHCHTEHKGRSFNIVRLDKEVFNHKITDFVLKGAHTQVPCASCHQPKAKYREAASKCVNCHRKEEPHHGRLGTVCENCHVEQSWKESSKARRRHAKTKFPLIGRHQKVACRSCHPNERYKNTPMDCFSCHRLDDVHKGLHGKKCEKCHSPKDWKEASFDHDKTDFPLRGEHRRVRCESCHTDRMFKDKLPTTCYGCHRKDDEHRGRYGKKCETCHNTNGWKRTRFDHAKTQFPLRGAHRKVDCDACHVGPLSEMKTARVCYDCHKVNDVHGGQQGRRCDRCHNETGWKTKVSFDHDLTKFPLIGLHATAPCGACHLAPTYKDAEAECISCHASDDVHKRRLGTKCGFCHNPNGWRLWRFDHNTQTDFVLDGAHKGLECAACHNRPVRGAIRMSTACVGCHQADDIHRGMFGMQCERCHVTRSFREVSISR